MQHCEIQMQDVYHGIPAPFLDSTGDSTSSTLLCDAESMPKSEASVDHVYMDPWCTYYELSINLGPSWWNQQEHTVGLIESAEPEKFKFRSVCSWTVHRRFVF